MRRSKGVRYAALLAFLAGPASAEIACIATKKANVRAAAAVETSILWVTHRHTPYMVLDRDRDWIHVMDMDGSEGWIHASVTYSGRCVMVAGRSANVRAGPGLRRKKLWSVELGYPFRVLARTEEWIKVTDDERVAGWVRADLLWGNMEPDRGES